MSQDSAGEPVKTSGIGFTLSPHIVLAAATALMTVLLGVWSRSAAPDPRQVPLISGEERLLYMAGFGAAIGVGLASFWLMRVYRPATRASEWSTQYTVPKTIETGWILPAFTMLGAFLFVARYHRGQDIAAAMLLAGSGVFAAITVRESLTEDEVGPMSPARLVHLVLTVGIAFALFALILLYRTRTLYSGPLIFGIGFLLLLQSQDRIPSFLIRRIAYALIGATALAQATWALTLWPPSGWWAGGVLAAILLGYVVVSEAQLAGRLSRELAINSVGVAATLMLACAYLAR